VPWWGAGQRIKAGQSQPIGAERLGFRNVGGGVQIEQVSR
jgi:hypothetical protein